MFEKTSLETFGRYVDQISAKLQEMALFPPQSWGIHQDLLDTGSTQVPVEVALEMFLYLHTYSPLSWNWSIISYPGFAENIIGGNGGMEETTLLTALEHLESLGYISTWQTDAGKFIVPLPDILAICQIID